MQKTVRFFVLLCCFLGWDASLHAQLRQEPVASAEILQSIQKLNVLGTVLYFAAHPDDENTRLIAWSAREMHYRTAYLSLTRGDGGQNLIGTELAEELGLIRTQELLAARQVDGGEQYFSRANDFGFSKTPEETIAFWGKEAILADAVWVIRQLKPDVILTRFPPDPRGGHGHHQAATILAIEAFEAAGNPNRFPEQLAHTEVWQAKRLMWNTANFGGQNNTSPQQFQIDIGQFHTLSGQSYGEIAAESRSKHKSQGFGAARQRGSTVEFFESLDGEEPVQNLMDGVDTSWDRLPGAAKFSSMIDGIAADFDIQHPERSLPALLALLADMEALEAGNWKDQKIKELKDIILACGGIWFESYAHAAKVPVDSEVKVRTDLIVRRPNVEVEAWSVTSGERTVLAFNKLASLHDTLKTEEISQPYWLRLPKVGERFDVGDPSWIGHAESPDHLQTRIRLRILGHSLEFQRPVVFKYTHPVQGELHQSLTVSPRVTANLNAQALVFTGGQGKTIEITFTHHGENPTQAEARPIVPEGWGVNPSSVRLDFQRKDQEISQRFTLEAIAPNAPVAGDWLEINIQQSGSTPEQARMIRSIDYPHIPLITYFPSARVRLSHVETGVSARRIGYLAGAGDLVPDALREIGLQVDLLTEQDILDRDLSSYDALISGIRAYNVLPRMGALYEKLMAYVEQGGTYLMQYNVSSGLSTQDFGPFPFQLSRLRVTDETAEVRINEPNNRILHHPNRITNADFEGWVQERGLYFPIAVDPAYEQPLSMNDPGEQPLDGAVIIGRHGKGKFVYTSLAFFRQLPAGVPGAYRLFINLIAHD